MKNVLLNTKNFKIVPNKFRSSTIFDLLDSDDSFFQIELKNIEENELNDYIVGEEVEIFGLGADGLVYFVTTIEDKNNYILKLKMPSDYKNVQRREYSRVAFEGEVFFEDETIKTINSIDISAGGIKFIVNKELELDKDYNIKFNINDNMEIKCSLVPIRIMKDKDNNYLVCGKFMNLENIYKVALIQYSFKILLETETLQAG